MKPTKILFLAANPASRGYLDREYLALDEEYRKIRDRLGEAPDRDKIELTPVLAARPDDWLKEPNAQQFRVIHFSGHGTRGGALQHVGGDGFAQPVPVEAIKEALHIFKGNICLLILNACYSRQEAEKITEEIDCVIAMNDAIYDKVAIIFISAFYRALFSGKSVQNAFEQGKAAPGLEGLKGAQVPELLVRPGVDASKVMLIEPAAPKVTLEPAHRDKAVILLNPDLGDVRALKALKELQGTLDFYKQNRIIDYWDRTQLSAGSLYRQETLQALTSARVAILLINQGFLTSKTIMQEQLPVLLQAAERGETKILCVLLSACTFEYSDLSRFTPVNSKLLSKMSRQERDEVWQEVAASALHFLQNT